MSDDLSMKALSGPFAARARAVLDAGSDLALHCNGALDEMKAVAAAAPRIAGACEARLERALAVTRAPRAFDIVAAESALATIMALNSVA